MTFVWVMGIKISTGEGMIFEKMGKWGEEMVDKGYKIFDAIIVCPWCLPSIHSVFGYAFAYGLGVFESWDMKLIVMWPLVVMGTSFLSGNAWNLHQMCNRIKDKNEAEAKYLNSLMIQENRDDKE